jgi:hypothetical protein
LKKKIGPSGVIAAYAGSSGMARYPNSCRRRSETIFGWSIETT